MKNEFLHTVLRKTEGVYPVKELKFKHFDATLKPNDFVDVDLSYFPARM